MKRTVWIPLLLLSSLTRFSLAADGWPVFRGPTADGHVKSRLPLIWSDSLNVAWKQTLPGRGWSTPVISGDQLFVTSAVPVNREENGDKSLRLLAFDYRTGESEFDVEVFYQKAADAPSIHEKNSHASPTPIVEGERVYVHFGHQGTACLTRTGEVIWGTRQFQYSPVHGNGGSPLLVGDILTFNCDGGDEAYIVGLHKESGRLAWKVTRQTDATRTFSFCTPSLIQVQGEQQLISPGSNSVDALDPLTGGLLWRVRYDGYSVIPQPVSGHGLVYVCTGYDRVLPTLAHHRLACCV